MPEVIGKIKLCSTDLTYFKSMQGFEGKTLIERYESSIKIIVNHYIDKRYQYFLAQPVQEGDIITWYGKPFTETPRILSELPNDDALKYTKIKDEILAHYNDRIKSLKDSGKEIDADLLTRAIKFIDDQFIYCYDDSVVLVAWGMQLKENLRRPIGIIRKDLFEKNNQSVLKSEISSEPISKELIPFTIKYNSGENGTLIGKHEISKMQNDFLSEADIPEVIPNDGYEFVGWDENPLGYQVAENKEFTALYKPKEIIPPINPPVIEPKLPWWKRFWNWLRSLFTGKGCLKYLLWLLLFLLLILLFWWLFRSCSGHHLIGGSALSNNDSTWLHDDPHIGDGGGIYDPHNPYSPVPTPPNYKNILPPEQGVLPPIKDNPEIIPGNPTVIGNRLNILMENEDKSILELAKDFKAKYPDNKYKIVYYDNVVKRMQIEIPTSDREKLKREIPVKFAPEYELFVFDEALFEGNYTPNDPVFKDKDKDTIWYFQVIKALQAWNITRGSDKITIAIVDNGFNLKHPELSSKVVMPYNVWTHNKHIFPQTDDHGTQVAGIALAIGDNEKGMCGIAPSCKFMPVQVADSKNMMTTTSVLDGILYALYQGADVINISLGYKFTGLDQYSEDYQLNLIHNHFKEEERLWQEIMKIAALHNSTIVIAAGNDNVLAGIEPLQRPELFITVSAIDKNYQNFEKATFSNYGLYSTVSAPGVDIYTTTGANGYNTINGTSVAAPIVSGAVALMKSLNNKLTNKQIICILQNTGLPVQGNIGNLIQLDKALQKVKSGEVVDCTPAPSSGDVQILLSWNNYNDLDLCCIDPAGEMIWYKNKKSKSGGQLEIDRNVEYPDSRNPVENIYWGKDKAPAGTYNVYLLYYKKHEPITNETPYAIKVKFGNKTSIYKGIIKKEDNILHICTFTLGNVENNQNSPNIPSDNIDFNKERRNFLLKERDRLQKELDRVERELKSIENH